MRNYFKIGLGVWEELSFKSIVNGRMEGQTTDEDRSKKLTLSLRDR